MDRPPFDDAPGRRVRPRPVAGVVLALAGCGGGTDDPPAAPAPVAEDARQAVAPDPAWLASSAPVATLTKSTLDATGAQRGWAALAGPARCDVTVHEIVHPTTGPNGERTDASGAVLVPSGADCTGPYPVLSYSRGTDRDRSRTMVDTTERETQAIAGFFAARGYVVVASDYLGYGKSSFPYHPYLHAGSEARTTIDALLAGRALLARLGVAESGRVFLAGYSQGGHAALAAQRAIERDRPPGVPAVTATGAMSGPYDLAGSFAEVAALAPLLAVDFGDSPTLRSIVLRLGDVLGTGAAELLAAGDRLRETLQANSVIGWTPRAPLMLCGGSRDPVVPFSNTRRAAEDFASRGVPPAVVDVEQEPAFASRLPPPDAPVTDLGGYHAGTVPVLCFAAVRDRWIEPRR
jgi:pimeloyl-ACP methyl ester carboxylesterase